jgi:thiamine kinase-like enzyme
MNDTAENRIAALPCWQGNTTIESLSGGMTNLNFKVNDNSGQYVVRLGEDDPIHLISRANEIASCQAAFDIGVSPELVYQQPGMLVVRFIEGKVFAEADVREGTNLQRIIELLRRFHQQMPMHFRQVPVMFWVFQVLRHYNCLLQQGDSVHQPQLKELAEIATRLESDVGPVEIVFGHNDLLAANFIDDGDKIWLIDFDYAGFNSPLFDLSNLASNNELEEAQERDMLEAYFATSLDESKFASYHAMKCASLLRETMWSMVSELHSRVEMDFSEYTRVNQERFKSAYYDYKHNFH